MTFPPTAGRGPGLREVLAIAVVVALAVLAVEVLSSVVPGLRDAFRSFPLTVLVLVVGTGLVLALVLRRPSGQG
jgi:hypothetical protein